jgi:HSP20 family molecular chaperone IbpA
MWAEALDLLQGGEQLRRRFVTVESRQSLPCWEPSVDLYENGDELRLLVALPGVKSRQVEVRLDDQGLLVHGERPIPSACQQAAIHRLEIPYGRFERRIALPPGRYRLHQQFIEDGCLVLVLRHH